MSEYEGEGMEEEEDEEEEEKEGEEIMLDPNQEYTDLL